MATKKKMLQAAAGNATGGAGLNVEDVFSTYLYTGTSTNQTLTNGLKNDITNEDVTTVYDIPPTTSTDSVSLEYFDDSTLTDTGTPPISTDSHKTNGRSVNLVDGGGYRNSSASNDFAYGTGDYCIELWVKRTTATSGRVVTHSDNSLNIDINSSGGITTYQAGSVSAPGGSVPVGQWVHFAITRSSGTVRLFINGTLQSSGPSSENYSTSRQIHIGADNNFTGGNFPGLIGDVRVFKGSANYTSNFTPATTLTDTTNVFLLISYNSSTTFTTESVTRTLQTVHSHVFGWAKNRGNSNYHALSNTLVGGEYALISNSASAERYRPDTKYISSLTSDGVVLGTEGDINSNGGDFVSWWWRQAPKFFDVVTYTGDGNSSQTIPHGLGAEVGCLIVKARDQGTWNWRVYHRSQGSGVGAFLDSDSPFGSTSVFPSTHTTTDFTVGVGTAEGLNTTGETYVAYLFAHNDGDGEFGPDGDADIIKCGSYTGTGAAGNFIDLGFEPQWVLTKKTDSANNWVLQDNMRSMSHSGYAWLYADLANAESSGPSVGPAAAVPNGYVINNTGGGTNASGGNYIYIAIRRGTKVPESATEVFAPVITDQTNDPQSGFPIDLWWLKARNGPELHILMDRMRGTQAYLSSDSTAVEGSNPLNYYRIDNMTGGFSNGGSYSQYVHWLWKRAPGHFDVVAYSGNATAGRTVPHNLGVAPELMIAKTRDAANYWVTYDAASGPTKFMILNQNNGTQTSIDHWNNTAPTASVFTVGDGNYTNRNATQHIIYLFATLPGVSKVGSYTGNGTSQTIDCGFTSGARFILIKRSNDSGGWYVWDTARGIVSGDDPFLQLNSTAAELTGDDSIDPASSGFIVNQTGFAAMNVSGGEYIFYAIA